ncbi:hypothetical protein [Geotalea uraniireducens]|uniref:Uncharacterized protein n=1 Tax=Geotalea uraniireducens (strain Rf4) TaxID=351605 RepID=A5G5E8_GEOUR|nr:hypothetical protein [Geotalea uraniireducens]ABQ27016.1 hypothetical protein Gura_2843 [Geotalea uraniireducens Rf4]
MRRLVYIPIIHTEVDMGSLSEDVRNEFLARYGKSKWLEHLRLISQLWDTIRKRLLAMPLDYARTKLYQDGLPVCGKESDIVQELAGMGSRNHMLLMELVEKGAAIIGTEDPNLLLEEHRKIKAIIAEPGARGGKGRLDAFRSNSNGLLAKRDEFIAKRISDTLEEGETGVLFIGAMHKVEKRLPKDIKVIYLT